MSTITTFDELDQAESTTAKKPFFAIDLSSEDVVLNWFKDEMLFLKNINVTRMQKIKNNYLRYKGYQYLNSVYYPRDVLETQRKYTPQMVLPLISDAVDEKTARLMEYKKSIVVMPVSDEEKDKVDAKVAKKFLDYVDYNQKLDTKFRSIVKNSKITGESFAWIRWNPDLGEVLGEVKVLNKVEISNENPHPTELIRQGDIEVLKKTAHWVMYERAESWDKVNYCFVIELDYVEALKMDYPDKADKIREDSDAKMFDYDKMEDYHLPGTCKKIHFYHRRTKYLPQGYEACFTASALLKTGPLSYEHGELPIERLVDIDNDEELPGQSFVDKVKSISAQINNSLNSVVKMMMLAGYAKWFVEGGAVDDQSLNNDISIVKIKPGYKAPVLAQANPVGQGHFAFIEKLQEWFYLFSKSNSVMRGEPPSGVTAGVALQYVSESESRRMTSEVQQLDQFVRNVNDKILKVAAQFYKPDEPRTMMVMGTDNRWETMPLDVSTLTKPYSIMLQNTSGLSDSKAVRTQQLIDLNAAFPNQLPQSQIIEMLGLAQGDKFYDIGSAAARAAEQENETIFDGQGQVEPMEYEDHLTHWRVHLQSIQSMGFKQKASPEIQNAIKLHIMAHEYLMIDLAVKSPPFAQMVGALPGFPLFANLPPVPEMPPMPPMGPEMGPGTAKPSGPMAEQGPPPAPEQQV
jgi:hypothetical protein